MSPRRRTRAPDNDQPTKNRSVGIDSVAIGVLIGAAALALAGFNNQWARITLILIGAIVVADEAGKAYSRWFLPPEYHRPPRARPRRTARRPATKYR